MRSRVRLLCAPVLGLGVATLAAACTDPVRDSAIAGLGPEDPGGAGPEHRAGQPCLLCHAAGGPADGSRFAVAGTVYENESPTSPGAAGIEVRFVDLLNDAPRVPVITNAAGNFYVYERDWPKLIYPFKVALFRDGKLAQAMTTTVNREGSCNYCHRPNAAPPFDDVDVETARRFYGQIYVTPGRGGEP
jgi:hypothetical protein